MAEKPKVGLTDTIGMEAVDYVRAVVRGSWKCSFAEMQGPADRGMDGIVQDVYEDVHTSRSFYVQIKGGPLKWQVDGRRCRVPNVTDKHVALWADSNVPVVVICLDTAEPRQAYWTLVRKKQQREHLFMEKHRVFGPASRLEIMAAVYKEFGIPPPSVEGTTLRIPLNSGIRGLAKDYYRREMISNQHTNDVYGPVAFTWKGWKHLTRRRRGTRTISNSLLLLPCVRLVLAAGAFPTSYRTLKPVTHNGLTRFHTLLVFDHDIRFRHRTSAKVRVVIEQQMLVPENWISASPLDPKRRLFFKFLSVYERRENRLRTV